MATMLPKVLEMERCQLADYGRVDYAITKGENEIAALEELRLGPDELPRETSVVRDRTGSRCPRGSQEHGEARHHGQEHAGAIGRISASAFTFCYGGHCPREFTRTLLREFGVRTDPYAHLSLHRCDQGWRLCSRRKCSL